MRQELEDKLFNDFPVLFRRVDCPKKSCMFWGFECGDGWYDIIRELSEKLEAIIRAAPYEEHMQASQVKEKYGALRFYMTCETDEMSELIYQAEKKSIVTCEICGEEGQLYPEGWVVVRCEKHKPELRVKTVITNDEWVSKALNDRGG